jgi:hypothetical protein
VFSLGTKQKFTELLNNLKNTNKKKHTKKDKKNKRRHPVEPADSRGPHVIYVLAKELRGAPLITTRDVWRIPPAGCDASVKRFSSVQWATGNYKFTIYIR